MNIIHAKHFDTNEQTYPVFWIASKLEYIKLKDEVHHITFQEFIPTEDNSEKLLLLPNHPDSYPLSLKLSLSRFGDVESLKSFPSKDRLRKLFLVKMKSEDTQASLLKLGKIFDGKNLVRIEKFIPKNNQNTHLPKFKTLKLTNLPLGTTDFDLSHLMNSNNIPYWRIPFSRLMKRVPVCYIRVPLDFEPPSLITYESIFLKVYSPEEKVCDRCIFSDHSYRECSKFIPSQNSFPLPRRIDPNISFASSLKQKPDNHPDLDIVTRKEFEELKLTMIQSNAALH